MKADIKSRWTAELRSGRFEQGHGSLRLAESETGAGDTYCCLGVLCELAVEAGVIRPARQDSNGLYQYDGQEGVLPASVADWAETEADEAGYRTENPHFYLGKGKELQLTSLADENDGGLPFGEIADLIDKHL